MFVKIIRDTKTIPNETIYECSKVSLCERPREENEPKPKIPQSMLKILDVCSQYEQTIYLERNNLELIYMSNEGKTIDRKVW